VDKPGKKMAVLGRLEREACVRMASGVGRGRIEDEGEGSLCGRRAAMVAVQQYWIKCSRRCHGLIEFVKVQERLFKTVETVETVACVVSRGLLR